MHWTSYPLGFYRPHCHRVWWYPMCCAVVSPSMTVWLWLWMWWHSLLRMGVLLCCSSGTKGCFWISSILLLADSLYVVCPVWYGWLCFAIILCYSYVWEIGGASLCLSSATLLLHQLIHYIILMFMFMLMFSLCSSLSSYLLHQYQCQHSYLCHCFCFSRYVSLWLMSAIMNWISISLDGWDLYTTYHIWHTRPASVSNTWKLNNLQI